MRYFLNRRAISPVIATVILMLMTVAAVGGAYHWMTTTQSSIQSDISASISAQTKRGKYTIKLVGLRCYDDRVIADIQNLGPDPISNSDVTISVYNYTSGALITSGITNISSLGVNDINSTQYIFYTPLKPDTRYSVKVSIGGVSEVSDSCYTIGRLVGLWHFDEGSGTVTNDSSGYGNNGTLYNGTVICADGDCPNWVDGKYGKALSFDGVNDYVKVPDSVSLQSPLEGTVEFWFKPIAFTAKESAIVVKAAGYSWSAQAWRFGLYTDNKLRFAVGDKTTYEMIYTVIEYGRWYHVAGRWNNGVMSLFLNGVEVDTNTYDFDLTTDFNVYMGDWGPYPGPASNILLDEVRIYNRALTEDEIRASYEQFK